jgi:hypothetical protein
MHVTKDTGKVNATFGAVDAFSAGISRMDPDYTDTIHAAVAVILRRQNNRWTVAQ